MSGAIFELFGSWSAVLRLVGSVVFAGVAIKLMDDYLDRDMDVLAGRRTVAAGIGAGTIAYALAALTVGMLLDPRTAGPLFLASYALGMGHEPGRRLPSGLAAWQESFLAVLAGCPLAGTRRMVGALLAMVVVQCVDDLMDLAGDRRRGHRSWAVRLGEVETGLLAAAALLTGLALTPVLLVVVVAAAILIEVLFRRAARLLPAVGESVGEGATEP